MNYIIVLWCMNYIIELDFKKKLINNNVVKKLSSKVEKISDGNFFKEFSV